MKTYLRKILNKFQIQLFKNCYGLVLYNLKEGYKYGHLHQ